MPVFQPSGCVLLASDVAQAIANDLQQRIAPEDPVVLDYINRVQLQLLRVARWKFALSPVQRFITQLGRTDYFFGQTGTGPVTAVDTGLDILDFGQIKQGTVYDRSNYRDLHRTGEAPPMELMQQRDGTSKIGYPQLYRIDPSQPNIINIYPAPNNQNGYQPVPNSPVISTVAGGSLGNRFYYIQTTIVDANSGESAASLETVLFIPAGFLAVVEPPQPQLPYSPTIAGASASATGVAYQYWNIYAASATGEETLQNASPLNISGNSSTWTEPTTGLITTGRSAPTTNTLEKLGGYLIEFRYFQTKPQVDVLTDSLVIPCDYLDVMAAGVNYFVAQFIGDQGAVQYWQAQFQAGIIGMIRDANLFPRGGEFIHPDPASAARILPGGIEVFDESNFPVTTSGGY